MIIFLFTFIFLEKDRKHQDNILLLCTFLIVVPPKFQINMSFRLLHLSITWKTPLFLLCLLFRCSTYTPLVASKAGTSNFSSKSYFNGTNSEFYSSIVISCSVLKLVLSGYWTAIVITCITFQYTVGVNAPSLSFLWKLTWRYLIFWIIWGILFYCLF